MFRKRALHWVIPVITLIGMTSGCHNRVVVAAKPKPSGPIPLSKAQLKAFHPNAAGAVMIVMFHKFEPNEPIEQGLNCPPAQFEKWLNELYKSGYRPISLTDFVENRINLPIGTTPIIFTFDDGWESQFKYIIQDGEPKIDPNCAVGMMDAFHLKHPDWATKGTFFLLPHSRYTVAPFHQLGFVDQKLQYLLKEGYEIGNHTVHHPFLHSKSNEQVEAEIGGAVKRLHELVPNLKIDTLALPYGSYPKDRKLAISGGYEGIKYHNQAVMLAGWRPVLSPITKPNVSPYNELGVFAAFRPASLDRIKPLPHHTQTAGLQYWIHYFDLHPEDRYISSGQPNLFVVPGMFESEVDPHRIPPGAIVQYY